MLTEKFALLDRSTNVDEIPWVPTFEGSEEVFFKPNRFDLTTGNQVHISKFKAIKRNKLHHHTQIISYEGL